jgi:MFS family permease
VNDTYWFILPALLPLVLPHFGLRYATAGGILTAFQLTLALSSFLLGRLSDRLSRPAVLAGGFFLSSIGLIACGLAGTLSTFVAWVLVAAVGVSAFHPVMIAWLDEQVVCRRGIVFSAFEFWGNAAVLAMFLLFAVLLRVLGWQGLLRLMGVPGLLAGVLFLRELRRPAGRPLDRPRASAARAARPADTPRTGGREAAPAPAENSPPSPRLLLPAFLAGTTLRMLGLVSVTSFVPTYLVQEVKLPASTASAATALSFAGGMLAVRFAGWLIDRWGPFPMLLACTVALVPLLPGLSAPLPAGPILGLLFLMGMFSSSYSPAQSLALSILSRRLRRGQAFGLLIGMNALTYSLGPMLFGLLADRWGLRISIRLFTLPILLGLLLFVVLFRHPAVRKTPA